MQQNPLKLSLTGTMLDIYKRQGILALWKGTIPTIIRNVPGSGLYFYTLNVVRTTLKSTNISPDIINIVSGSSSRVVLRLFLTQAVGFIMMPFTVLKTRFESTSFKYKTISQALLEIHRQEGISGYFKGFGVTVMRDAPFAGIYVFFYERMKALSLQSGLTNGLAINISSGLISGFMATLCTHPFDIVKTKIQVSTVKVSAIQAVRDIIQTGGIRGMFAGMLPRVLRKSMSSAISWAVYEEFVKR